MGRGGADLITAIVLTELTDGWAKYRPAIARWETLTRLAPYPTEPNKRGRPRANTMFVEWMMGWPDGWVTDVGLTRPNQLWILGNGVCPQQATFAMEAVGLEVEV